MNTRMAGDSRQIRAEAASWVARLHGPDRDEDMEVGFKRWLGESPAHARAFELATEVWQETADLPGTLPPRERAARPESRNASNPRRFLYAVAAAVPLAAAVGFWFLQQSANTLATVVGEQRTMTLRDGTRVELNTNTRLVVQYNDRLRKVVLENGEAWFDVASQPRRPFVVVAGDQEITALGTEFVVRRDERVTTVTLLEGKVAVAPTRSVTESPPQPRVLKPGERVRIAALEKQRSEAVVDTPALEKVTAWQRGQVVFEDTPLRDATAEFNRYSETRIVLQSNDLASIRVGGTFRVGDIHSFARAVAASHELEVIDQGKQVLLTR